LELRLSIGNLSRERFPIFRVFPVSLREKVREKKLTSVSGRTNQRRTTDVTEDTAYPGGSSTAI
jgi:hypothetical protein